LRLFRGWGQGCGDNFGRGGARGGEWQGFFGNRACPPAAGGAECEFDELVLAVAFGSIGARGGAAIGAVWGEDPGFGVVGALAGEDFVEEPLFEEGVDHGEDDLDPVVEVARHPVGTADEEFGGSVVFEAVDAAMLEEAADDGTDGDIFADAGDARAQAADSAYDELDLDAGGGGFVEGFDEGAVDEPVHLGGDGGGLSGASVGGLAVDEFEHALVEVVRGDEEFLRTLEAADAGEHVEEVGGVFAELGACGEEGEVGVELGGGGIVVAGAEVEVAPDLVFIAADDEGHLGVDLEVDHSIDDVDAGFLEASGPEDVIGLVEAGLQFGDRGDLLAVSHGAHEGAHDAGIPAGAVEGLFDGQHIGVGGGVFEKIDDRAEVFVGVVEEEVALANGAEEVGGLAHGGGLRGDEGLVAEFRGVGAGVDGHEAGRIEGAVDEVEVVLGQVEGFEEVLVDFGGRVVIHLESDGGSFAAVVEFLFDGAEEVSGVVLVDVELAVARHSEVPEAAYFGSGEEVGEMVADHLAQEDVVALIGRAGQLDDAGQHLGDLDDGEMVGADALAFQLEVEDDVEGFVEELGEGMGGVDAQRGEHGADLIEVVGVHPLLGGGVEVVGMDESDAVFGELGEEVLAPAAELGVHHGLHAGMDGAESFLGGESVGGALGDGAFDLLFESGDADLEELVEVGADDAEEFDAFEQGEGLIEGLLEDALVEFEPAEFPGDEMGGGMSLHSMVETLLEAFAFTKQQSCEGGRRGRGKSLAKERPGSLLAEYMKLIVTVFSLLGLALFARAEPLAVGAAAPEVTAPDQNGQPVVFKDVYAKGPTLVYFYPKADTPGCTKQACSLRDDWAALKAKGIQVLGVSGDKPEAQKKFEEKFQLPFTLVADSEGKVAAGFGVPFFNGIAKRMSFLVKDGKVVWNMLSASTAEHSKDVIKAFDALPK
jgi:peroxiredoxin Q/BCP